MKNRVQKLMLAIALWLGVMSSVAAFNVETWKTSNGVNVLFVETHDLPIVDVRFTFKAGSSRDGKQYGISRLVNALLVEGTGDSTAEDIALTFESAGAQMSHNSLRDMAWTSLRSLSDPKMLAKTADMFARVTALPSFPKDAIERDRQSMLIGLANRTQQISKVTEDAFFNHVYSDHAYQVGSHGTETTLKDITQDDLKQFHSTYYVGNNANLALVGDLTLTQARQYADQLTQFLKPGRGAPVVAKPKLDMQGKTIRVPFKTTQSHIIQGMPVLTRKDPDYFALYVGNHILGGSGFSSRLMQEIRENRGLVYSVYSFFAPMESHGPFEMALQTSNKQVEEASQLLQQMLEEFIQKGPTDEELEHAQKNITGSFPLKIDSNKKIVDYLSLMGFYDLPLDYLDKFNSNVLAVSNEDIKDAFQRRVKPEQMIRIIVGESS
ncbi:MAG: pitrilysin family protein [Gammaproteobacteria bacterium]|nr:pitrilysin family protein [Gammaproteobacteria bacterium]